MEWRQDLGKEIPGKGIRRVDQIIEQKLAQGDPIEERLFDPLWPESEFFMRAWQILRPDAPIAAGFAPVPWTAIYSYAQAHSALGDLDLLVRMVWALDRRMGEIEADRRKILEEARDRDRSGNQDHRRSFGGSAR